MSNVKYSILFSVFMFGGAAMAQRDTSFSPYSQTLAATSFQYKMVPIQGGTFRMGGGSGDKNARLDESPVRTITITPFWMGAYEVTHDQFALFYDDESVSQGSKTDAVTRPTAQYIDLSWNMGKDGGFPVNSMSQDGALMFCRWLYQKSGVFYRLPTEAEWEYACRAGSNTAYFFGDDAGKLDEYAWYKANSKNKYKKVGQKKPNPWGLYDMIGNVSEWTLDQYAEKYSDTGSMKNPVAVPSARYPRAIRGGSYKDDPDMLRSAAREHSLPEWNRRDPQVPKSRWWLTDGMFVGFRIVRPVQQPSKEEAENFYRLYLGK